MGSGGFGVARFSGSCGDNRDLVARLVSGLGFGRGWGLVALSASVEGEGVAELTSENQISLSLEFWISSCIAIWYSASDSGVISF